MSFNKYINNIKIDPIIIKIKIPMLLQIIFIIIYSYSINLIISKNLPKIIDINYLSNSLMNECDNLRYNRLHEWVKIGYIIPSLIISIILITIIKFGENLTSLKISVPVDSNDQYDRTFLYMVLHLMKHVYTFGVFCIVIPVLEEVIFRKIFPNYLRIYYNISWLRSIIISSLFFSLIHLIDVPIYFICEYGIPLYTIYIKLINMFFLGIILGTIVDSRYTGLFTTITIHVLYNSISIISNI